MIKNKIKQTRQMENKQTAVEWLVEEIEKHYIVNNGILNPAIVMQLKRQAKAMYKEQIEESHLQGLYSEIKMRGEKQAEQYYNETYGKN